MSQKEIYIHNIRLRLNKLQDMFLRQRILDDNFDSNITPRALYILISMHNTGTYLFTWSDLDFNLPVYQHTKIVMDHLIALGLIKKTAHHNFDFKVHKDTCALTSKGKRYLSYALPSDLSRKLSFSTIKGKRNCIYSVAIVMCSLITMITGLLINEGIIPIIVQISCMLSSWGILLFLLLIFSNLTFGRSEIFLKKRMNRILKKDGHISKKDYIVFLNRSNIYYTYDAHRYDYILHCLNSVFCQEARNQNF